MSEGYFPVPVLEIKVDRVPTGNAFKNTEYTETKLDTYFVVPEDCCAGVQTRRLSFQEAINLLTV